MKIITFIPLYIYNNNNKEDIFNIKNIIIQKENLIRNNLNEILNKLIMVLIVMNFTFFY